MAAGRCRVFFLVATVLAADPNVPHPHRGVVTPYAGAPPTVFLSAADLAALASGQGVLKQQQVASGGRGIAVLDIAAAPKKIWSKILDYAHYPAWVERVAECGNYRVAGDEMYTRFLLSVMGMDVEYYIHHRYHPEANYLTWTLDYSRRSDLDDSVGYWRVIPDPDGRPRSRLEYSVDIRFTGYVPGFIQDAIAKKGLTDATAWVKRESEKGA